MQKISDYLEGKHQALRQGVSMCLLFPSFFFLCHRPLFRPTAEGHRQFSAACYWWSLVT